MFQSGIGVIYRENAAGRLYGVTFIDHNVGDSIGSLFDIPILPNATDPEEEEFRRQMQRKKKKRGFGL